MRVEARDDSSVQVQAMLDRSYRCSTLAILFAYPETGQGEALYRALATFMTRWDAEGDEARRALAAFVSAWEEGEGEALRAEYARLFLGRTPCPLHSAAYGSAGMLAGPAAELADVSGFYQAFGIDVREDAPERPDHLAVQLEFYATLLAKEAYACFNGWSEREAVTRDAARDFLNDHLGRWQGALMARLEHNDAASPFPEATRWLDRFLVRECHVRDVQPRPFGVPVEDHMQSDCLVCPNKGSG